MQVTKCHLIFCCTLRQHQLLLNTSLIRICSGYSVCHEGCADSPCWTYCGVFALLKNLLDYIRLESLLKRPLGYEVGINFSERLKTL